MQMQTQRECKTGASAIQTLNKFYHEALYQTTVKQWCCDMLLLAVRTTHKQRFAPGWQKCVWEVWGRCICSLLCITSDYPVEISSTLFLVLTRSLYYPPTIGKPLHQSPPVPTQHPRATDEAYRVNNLMCLSIFILHLCTSNTSQGWHSYKK